MSSLSRLNVSNSQLLVVDVQDKLLAAMPNATLLVKNVAFLVDVAKLLDVTVNATEQYPKGLGPTTAELSRRLPVSIPAKTAFSAFGSVGTWNKPCVVLTGMETHVCIAQTAWDLIEAGQTVFLPVDAISSRFAIDHETALRRLEKAGAVLTTSEAIAFEWLGDAAHPQFKAVSKLVIERSKQ